MTRLSFGKVTRKIGKNVIIQPIAFPPLKMMELSGTTPADGTFSNRIIYAQLDDSSCKKNLEDAVYWKSNIFHSAVTAAVKGISPHNSSHPSNCDSIRGCKFHVTDGDIAQSVFIIFVALSQTP